MSIPPNERGVIPEPARQENILYSDPTELLRANPAALIVNTESYGRMEAHFSPGQFDPPQVARVKTFSSEHGEIIILGIIDGMTRTKFNSDQKSKIASAHPGFRFHVRDVTSHVLQNSKIVPNRADGQQELSMGDYLRAVVPPTAEHSAIASNRIAAHLINGWESMVGEELSEKFSALAALNIIAKSSLAEKVLRLNLSREKELLVGESVDDRSRLEEALLETASIIREARLNQREVARSAFDLVSAQSAVIGGERHARKQIYGLMQTPEVDRKLTEAFPQVAERESARAQLGQYIVVAFNRFSTEPDGQQAVNVIHEALRDSQLNFAQVREIATALAPIKRYEDIKQEANRKKLEGFYIRKREKDELTGFETSLIDQLGRRTLLADREMPAIAASIENGSDVLQRASTYRIYLVEDREELIRRGVRQETIDDAIAKIEGAQSEVLTPTSVHSLSRRTAQFIREFSDIERRINTQLIVRRISDLVDTEFTGEMQKGYLSESVRSGIVAFLFRDVDNLEDESQVLRRIRSLKSLDRDLQQQVISASKRLDFALREQTRRSIKRIDEFPPEEVVLEIDSQTRQITEEDFHHPETEGEEMFTRQDAEARRIEINNGRISVIIYQHGDELVEELDTIDIDHTEISVTNKERIDRVLRSLGKRRFNHPDIVRVFEEHDRLIEENSKLRAALVQKEEADTSQDKRTGR